MRNRERRLQRFFIIDSKDIAMAAAQIDLGKGLLFLNFLYGVLSGLLLVLH